MPEQVGALYRKLEIGTAHWIRGTDSMIDFRSEDNEKASDTDLRVIQDNAASIALVQLNFTSYG